MWYSRLVTVFQGKIEYKNGTVFEGKAVDYIPKTWKGSYYLGGSVYTGEIENWTFNGRIADNNGTDLVLVGTWNSDYLVSAQGKRVINNNVYEGEFFGNTGGKGKITFQNGDVYEGSWNDNDWPNNGRPFDGKGSLAFLNYVLTGTWKNETGSGVVESTDNSNQI